MKGKGPREHLEDIGRQASGRKRKRRRRPKSELQAAYRQEDQLRHTYMKEGVAAPSRLSLPLAFAGVLLIAATYGPLGWSIIRDGLNDEMGAYLAIFGIVDITILRVLYLHPRLLGWVFYPSMLLLITIAVLKGVGKL